MVRPLAVRTLDRLSTQFSNGEDMQRIIRLSNTMACSAVLVLSACDAPFATPVQPRSEAANVNLELQSVTRPITGIWSGVVTDATDLNAASFGRPAGAWVGKAVIGSFSIRLTNAGVGDRNPEPNVWEFGPVPGPGPFIEFVQVNAFIDGKAFQSSRNDYATVFFGDVLGVRSLGTGSAFNPQDSYVGTGVGGTGRSVVGFDASFASNGVSFDGANIDIDPARLVAARGVVDDLLERGGLTVRRGTIAFRVTKVALTSAGGLMTSVLAVGTSGGLRSDQISGLIEKVAMIEQKLAGGNARATCNQLAAFANQVRGLANGGFLTAAESAELLSQVGAIRGDLGC
jgi:hypothetical protein